MKKVITIALILLFLTSLTCSLDSDVVSDPNPVLLKSRQFTPVQKVQDAVPANRFQELLGASVNNEPVRKLIQFDHIPTSEEKQELSENGVTLLVYIPDNAWIASVAPGSTDVLEAHGLTFTDELSPEDKISQRILESGPGKWSLNPDGTFSIVVMFFSDAPVDEIRNTIEKYGKVAEALSDNIWSVKISEDSIIDLASENIVEWIEDAPLPLLAGNDESRSMIGADTVQSAPYSLNGSGVVIAMWDAGHASHTDFSNRTTIRDPNDGSVNEHATHVAGTLIGNGSLSNAEQWKGMAPNATLVTYEWPGPGASTITELKKESNDSVANYSAVIFQNSWGSNVHIDCSKLGEYTSTTQIYDSLIRWNSSIINITSTGVTPTIVFASGNERGTGQDEFDLYYCGSPTQGSHTYNTTTGPGATAKNTITVGALDKSENMYSSSSWGPTDDGRIKPEVVAIGASIASTCLGDNYCEASGTSMAAPAVSGAIALLHQKWNLTQSDVLRPATVKAILTHTAKDKNETGPDYTTGFGLINVTRAIDLVDIDNTEEFIVQASLSQAENNNYTFYVNSTQDDLKLTLVWDDYPGTPAAAKELVNDLDLVIYAPNGSRHYPWTLDPDNPSTPAVRNQKDDINVIEQVLVSSPDIGAWTVLVNGTSIPQSPERYSLVSSHDLNHTLAVFLESPADNFVSSNISNIIFNCSALATYNLTNISFYNNFSGAWGLNETINLGGESNWTNFTISNISGGIYSWNCMANDTLNNSVFAGLNRTLIIDIVPPQAALNSPANFHNFSSSSVNFNCSATDDHSLSNATLMTNISGSWLVNETSAISGTSDSIAFALTNLPDGFYEWNCIVNDSYWNNATAASNRQFTVDLEAPNLTDITSGLLINRTEFINFTANTTDAHGIDYLELNISGSEYNLTQEGSSELYYYNWNSTSFLTKVYTYSIISYDIVGNSNTSTGSLEIAEKIYSNSTPVITANTSTALLSQDEIILSIVLNQTVSNGASSARLYTIDPNLTAGPAGKLNVSRFYEINVDSNISGNLSYALVQLSYDPAVISSKNIDESTLNVYKQTGGAWTLASNDSNTLVDTTNNFVRINLTSFSMYALFGNEVQAPSPPPPPESPSPSGGGPSAAPNPPKKPEEVEVVEEEPEPEIDLEYLAFMEEVKQDIQSLAEELETVKSEAKTLGRTEEAAQLIQKAESLIQEALSAAEQGNPETAQALYAEASSYIYEISAVIRAKSPSKVLGFINLVFKKSWKAVLVSLLLVFCLASVFYYKKSRKSLPAR